MRIIGIDPGTTVTGIGIVETTNGKVCTIYYDCLNLNSKDTLPSRLKKIYDECYQCIKRFEPDEFAIETAFYGKNVQSAMKIGYARGVSILCALHNKVPTSEYSPREVKKSVVGKGAASKDQVLFMIKTLLNIKSEKIKVDESDALAIALCHAFRMKTPIKKTKDWKSFIEAYPERVLNN